MAFLEWRRFNFFECHKVDITKIEELLQDTKIVVATSGNNHVIICDGTGWAHLISRSWATTSFKVHEYETVLGKQYSHDPYLVTVGEDEEGVNPYIKVWDWSRTDRHGNPILAHVCRAVPSNIRPTVSSALALHDNKNILAVGFLDGSVSLFQGDITRQRKWKLRTLSDQGTSAITGLAFKGKEQLFVVSRASVSVYWTNGDRSAVLDNIGAAPLCSVLADKQLMIARPDAIYCYTSEGRGPCYALEGEKVRLDWFRNYLIITTREVPIEVGQSSGAKGNLITILDIQNKFIVFTKLMGEVAAFLNDWGSSYLLLKEKQLWLLEEKDLQYKLELLFKKNLYDVAIRMAGSQHYDAERLLESCKQYGDHLYAKGDLKGAIDQYVKTIGYLETSYVIRKYLECRHLEPLVLYLEELHKKGYATEDHTTLLLTCFVKLDQHDQQGKLKQFILDNKKNDLNFDVDVAIKVVRQVSVEDAITLAAIHKRHDWYLKIIIEDKKDYKDAVRYLTELEFEDAQKYMKKYGNVLIQHAPVESTDFLKALCTEFKAGEKQGELERALPDDYIHLFLSNSEQLIEFLEHMVKSEYTCSNLVYNALIEHYVHVWAKSTTEADKNTYKDKIMKVLKNPEANYDKDQTLIICQTLGFKPGILHLYEESKLWRAQLAVHMRSGEWSEALEVCRRRGAQCPTLWLDVLWWPPPAHYLPELLHVIGNEKLLSPILVLDCLASTSTYNLGDVRKYLINIMKAETDVITREQELATKYRTESNAMQQQIKNIQQSPVTFQSSKCAACVRPLELPTVHFLCQHSYHQHCFQSYSEHETECPACATPASRQEQAAPRAAETLHARLLNDHDPYAVVSEYFGRGLFNKLTVLTPEVEEKPQPVVTAAPAPTPQPLPNYGPGAEARLRLEEGHSKQPAIIPIPEGRMRVMEATRYSTSLEANMNKLPEPRVHEAIKNVLKKDEYPNSSNGSGSLKISNSIANSNPFEIEEDDQYDEAMNPFNDDESTNPFSDDDDYDKNLNPFS